MTLGKITCSNCGRSVQHTRALILAVLLALAVSISGANAQIAASFEGKTVTDIQFTPRQPLDPADLAKALPIQKGSRLHSADVARAIDGLFATGRFEDIVVEAEAAGDGVTLRFVTQLTLFVGNVAIEGKVSAPPNEGQIGSATQLTLGAPFHDADVTTAVESVKTLLKSNGLYKAEVTPEIKRDDELQQVYITFGLREHKRAKYEMPAIQGNKGLSDATVLRATGWRVPLIHWWRHVTEERTSGGVRGVLAKYEKQNRLTAKAEIPKLDYDSQNNRVRPTLNITPGPKVKVTAVETKVSSRVLKRYVPIFEERTVYNELLVEGKRNLEDYFQSQGYYDAEVDFRLHPPENDLEKIEYVISRGARFKLVHLSLAGNKYFRTPAIQERLFMHESGLTLRHGRYSEAFRKKDEQNILDLYYANGFRDAKVSTAVERDYQGKTGQVAVTITIDEGPQWLVDNLTINGVTQADQQQLTAQLTSGTGQPFSDSNLASDRNYILTYYGVRGFPGVSCEAGWQPSGAPHHVNVVYDVVQGTRQYVRDVTITGLRTTRRSLVERKLDIHPGEPLSQVDQLEAQKRLYDLGVFARVDTAVENPDSEAEDHKYLLYSFEEANRYRLALGFGAQVANFGTPSTTSLSAPGGTTGFSPQVELDVSRLNFFGLGHTISLKAGYSSIEKRGSLSYLQPRLRDIHGVDVTYSLVYDNSLDVRTFASKREEGSVQVSDKFSKSLTGLIKFAYRRVSVSDVVIPVLLVPQLLQPVRIGMLSVNLAQDRRDNPGNPTHGMFNTIDVGLAGSFFGSQRSFARVLVRNATYYRLGSHVVLARQTRFGIIQPFSVASDTTPQESVPLPERFFGGGADSLRAFSYNQAGPRDVGTALVPGGPVSQPTGFPLGGNALLFNNVELRFPLIGQNIQGVLFYDAGNVYSSVGNISFRFHQRNLQDFDYMVHAPGIGLRYQTPIGPLRLDLAYSINPPSYNGFSGTPDQLLQCNPNLPPSQLPPYCQSTKQTLGHVQFFFSIGQTF